MHTDWGGLGLRHTAIIDLGFGEVALRFHDRYLRAVGGGGGHVRADAPHIHTHERFILGGTSSGRYVRLPTIWQGSRGLKPRTV